MRNLLPLETILRRADANAFEIDAIDWSRGVDRTKLFFPEHLTKGLVESANEPPPGGTQTGARIRSVALQGRTLKEIVAAEVDEIERLAISEVLKRSRYKKSKAATILGISRPTLDAKIEKYGLTRETVLESQE